MKIYTKELPYVLSFIGLVLIVFYILQIHEYVVDYGQHLKFAIDLYWNTWIINIWKSVIISCGIVLFGFILIILSAY